jgi:hypothetical protein
MSPSHFLKIHFNIILQSKLIKTTVKKLFYCEQHPANNKLHVSALECHNQASHKLTRALITSKHQNRGNFYTKWKSVDPKRSVTQKVREKVTKIVSISLLQWTKNPPTTSSGHKWKTEGINGRLTSQKLQKESIITSRTLVHILSMSENIV